MGMSFATLRSRTPSSLELPTMLRRCCAEASRPAH